MAGSRWFYTRIEELCRGPMWTHGELAERYALDEDEQEAIEPIHWNAMDELKQELRIYLVTEGRIEEETHRVLQIAGQGAAAYDGIGPVQ